MNILMTVFEVIVLLSIFGAVASIFAFEIYDGLIDRSRRHAAALVSVQAAMPATAAVPLTSKPTHIRRNTKANVAEPAFAEMAKAA